MGLARLVLVMGKGGVGKTTVAFGIASGLAQRGQRTLLVQLGVGSGARAALDSEELHPRVRVQVLSEEDALLEAASEVFGSSGAAKLVFGNAAMKRLSSVVPAVREYCLLVVARSRLAHYDHVVVDMPATGHGLAWLSAPAQLARLVPSGRAGTQARGLDRDLRDPELTSYVLVTLPEPFVLAESRELESALLSRFGVAVHHTILNRAPADTRALSHGQAESLLHEDPSMRPQVSALLAWSQARQAILVEVRAYLAHAKGRVSVLMESDGSHAQLVVERTRALHGVFA